MRFSRRSPLLSFVAGVGLLAVAVSAQGRPPTTEESSVANTRSSANDESPTSPAGVTRTAPSPDASESSTSRQAPAETTPTPEPEQTTESSTTKEDKKTTSSKSTPSITGATDAPTSATDSVPVITGASTVDTATSDDNDYPTLAGAYVRPSVPPTLNAPFMKQSELPEGTVFIIVGAILGFLAMSVMLWRGLVVWSLHRSIERAAVQQNVSTAKSTFQTPPAPFYAFKDRESALSVAGMGSKSNRKSARPSTATGVTNQSLFFSPTAGATGAGVPGNRASSYLPAGYYAAGAAQLGNGQGMAHVGTNSPGISLSNLGPSREGYAKTRSVGPSPPGSPYINAIPSSSSLNLSQPPGGQRAPSAYLDDLFDGEASPPPPNHRRNTSGPSRGSARF